MASYFMELRGKKLRYKNGHNNLYATYFISHRTTYFINIVRRYINNNSIITLIYDLNA